MFEAFAMICALSGPSDVCREALVPGFAAPDRAGCLSALAAGPPAWLVAAKPAMTDCQPRPGSRLQFDEIAPGVFVHLGAIAEADPDNAGDVANIAFVIGADSVTVIDTGGSRQVGEQAYLAVRERSELPISHVILTHMHPDHVLGAAAFADLGAAIVGHAHLPRALADRADSYLAGFGQRIGPEGFLGTRIVAPGLLVDDRLSVDLGARQLRIQRWPTGHSESDMTVFDPQTQTLFAGDLLFDQHAPAIDGSLRGWQGVLADLTGQPAARVVPGHGGPVLPWPSGADALLRYLAVLADDTRAAIDSGAPLGAAAARIGASEAGNWALFDLFNPRNATLAYTELEWE
ncbi:MAG: quinoprotein relay system zinc metallohydrolase 2 [Rhodobacteraceae bacterium]|nr:quinoprotein relay system zinc metallohydrolase 2 [Paracoccaceae bacterium]